MREITDHEFWVWWGIIITARIEGRIGTDMMWDRTDPEGYGSKVGMTKYMTKSRFKDIRSMIPYLFADESRKPDDS